MGAIGSLESIIESALSREPRQMAKVDNVHAALILHERCERLREDDRTKQQTVDYASSNRQPSSVQVPFPALAVRRSHRPQRCRRNRTQSMKRHHTGYLQTRLSEPCQVGALTCANRAFNFWKRSSGSQASTDCQLTAVWYNILRAAHTCSAEQSTHEARSTDPQHDAEWIGRARLRQRICDCSCGGGCPIIWGNIALQRPPRNLSQ